MGDIALVTGGSRGIGAATVKALAELIIELTGSSSKIVHLPPLKEGDMTRRMPDISMMREVLGRDPLPLKEGIKKILEDTSFILD